MPSWTATASAIAPQWQRKPCPEHCPEEHAHAKDFPMPLTARLMSDPAFTMWL